jgi:hypothetical protein
MLLADDIRLKAVCVIAGNIALSRMSSKLLEKDIATKQKTRMLSFIYRN